MCVGQCARYWTCDPEFRYPHVHRAKNVSYAPEERSEDVQVAEEYRLQTHRQDRVREPEHQLHGGRLQQPEPGQEAADHHEHVARLFESESQLSAVAVFVAGQSQVAQSQSEAAHAPAQLPRYADHTQQPSVDHQADTE